MTKLLKADLKIITLGNRIVLLSLVNQPQERDVQVGYNEWNVPFHLQSQARHVHQTLLWAELSLRLRDFDSFGESPSVCEASIQMEGAQCSTTRPARQKPLEVAKWGHVPQCLDFLWVWLGGLARARLCV